MKNKDLIFLIPLLIILLQLAGCLNPQKQTQSDDLEAAASHLQTHPDSTIAITDALLFSSNAAKPSDKLLLRILDLRQQAFSRMAQIDSIVITGERIREVAGRLKDSLSMARSLLPVKGNVDFSHLQKMEPYFPGAIALFRREGKSFEEAKLTGMYGAILTGKGDFKIAQEYLLKSYAAFEQMDSIRQLYSVSINIGNVYMEIGSDEKALEYFQKGKLIAERLNFPVEQASALMNIGLLFEKKSPDSALSIYNKALDLLPASSNDILRVKVIYNIAGVELKKGNVAKAEQLYQNILAITTAKNWYEGIAMVRGALSNVYQQKGQFQKALDQELETTKLFQSFGLGTELIRSKTNLMKIYEGMGDTKSALKESKELKNLSDSIFSVEKKTAIHDIEARYQFEKKEVENAKLRSDLQLRKFILISLGFLIVMLLIALYIFRQRNLFLRERNLSYEVLMKKYKDEMFEREQAVAPSNVQVAPIVPAEEKSDMITTQWVQVARPGHVSDLSEEEMGLLGRLDQLIEDEKLFLNPKLKIEPLAAKLGVNERILSNLVNRHFGYNVSQYINRFRVEEARILLERPDAMNLKLDSIGTSAGFGSRQNFYAVFEQVTGVNPGYYRSSIHEGSK